MKTPHPAASYTLVTVYFEAEISLLRLQARSLAHWVDPDLVDQVLLIDNGRGNGRLPAGLLQTYGPLAPKVRLLTAAQVADVPASAGWRSQQVLKLEVARLVGSDRYLLLDAKNHLVGALTREVLEVGDGRARCGRHPYTEHPLRQDLERTLRYLDLDPLPHLASFPPTATPFVIDRRAALATLDRVERRSGRPFPVAFEQEQLLEFFLYSATLHQLGRWDAVYADSALEAVTIWPRLATAPGVRSCLVSAGEGDVRFFSVHRTALVRLDKGSRHQLATFWVDRGLFDDMKQALRFIAASRVGYLVGMASRKLRELPLRRAFAARA